MSIAEVAKRAGVSAATVSNIINNKPKASAATIRRVRSAMEEIHYTPRPSSQRPGRNPSNPKPMMLRRIALIIPDCGLAQFQNPLYSFLVNALSQAAYERGATMVLSRIPQRGQLPENIRNGEMDGVVFVLKTGVGSHIDAIKKTPKVGILGTTETLMDSITVDNGRAGHMALDYLKSLGVKTYACLYDSSHWAQATRARTFRERGEKEGLPVHLESGPNLLIINDHLHEPDVAKIESVLHALLPRVKKPFGLFCPTDLITTSVYPLLYQRGIIPGKDVFLISCDNEVPYLIGLHPKPAEIDLNLEAMARRTLDQLAWRMENPSEPLNTVLIQPLLIPPDRVEAELKPEETP
jgi:LacI family transcriptional regulator